MNDRPGTGRVSAACAAALSLTTLPATNANAALLKMEFTGEISAAGSFEDPTGLFMPGDPLSGFWLVETTTADGDADPARGEYAQSGSPSFFIQIGASTFATDSMTIQILDDFDAGIGTIDAYDVLGGSATTNIADLTVNQMQWTIRDTQAPLDALDSDALPAAAPMLAAFDQVGQAQGQLTGNLLGTEFFMNLELDSVTAVPVPAAAWGFAAAAALLGARRRRRPSAG